MQATPAPTPEADRKQAAEGVPIFYSASHVDKRNPPVRNTVAGDTYGECDAALCAVYDVDGDPVGFAYTGKIKPKPTPDE